MTRIPQRGEPSAPLSPAQLRLWLLAQIEPSSSAYRTIRAYRIIGALAAEALTHGLTTIVERHEALRTTFPIGESVPVQRVQPASAFLLKTVDLTDQSGDERMARVRALICEEEARAFDLSRDLPFRVALIRLDASDHALVVSQHHIASDDWSVDNLHRELATAYRAGVTGQPVHLPPLTVQYSDYAAWQHDRARSADIERQLAYWHEYLSGAPPFLELPADRPSTALREMTAGCAVRVISTHIADAVEQLAGANGATPLMALLAAWKILLYRHAGVTDLVVGSPTPGRLEPETEPLIGFFANTLVLRTDLSGAPSFVECLDRVRRVVLAASDNQEVPFEQLVDALNPVRDVHRNPLVQVTIAYENVPAVPLALHELDVEEIARERETVPFALDIAMTRRPEGLQIRAAYQHELFESSRIERWLTHFEVLLGDIVRNPNTVVTQLAILDDRERATLRGFERGPSPVHATHGATVDALVAAQVARTPNAIAIEAGSEKLTFRGLWQRSAWLADRLHAMGVQRGDYVGIYLPRSIEALVAMLGILRAGAAYVPLDPAHPTRRHTSVLETVRPRAIVTTGAQPIHVPFGEIPLLEVTDHGPTVPEPKPTHRATDPAYVLFTSGSSGRPKGVVMPHRALVNLVTWHQYHERLKYPPRTLQFAPLTFDVSFQEIFTTWSTGGTVVLIDEEARRDPVALLRALARERISRLHIPFVALRQLAIAARRDARRLPALRDIISAGETLHLPEDLRVLLSSLQDCRLHNHYGPTEAHVVTAEMLPADPAAWPATASLGRPIDGVTIRVVDALLQPVPVGVPGEVVIGGVCLANGYVGQPDLTRERFVEADGSAPARLYRTGDRGQWRVDGTLEFLGRLDDQVKIRGVRVEPGEVEVVLGEHPAVAACAVDVRADSGGDKRLIAYVVLRDSTSVATLHAFLGERLPDALVPALIIALPTLPRTTSGKADRAQLPDPGADEAAPVAVRPLTDTETVLLRLWRDTLGRKRINVTDSFFDLGGHSLLAVRLFTRIEQAFGRRFALSTLFQHSTIEALARELDTVSGTTPWTPIVPIARGARPSLFLVHGIGGEVLMFRELGRHLHDRRVYGIEAAGPGSGAEPDQSIGALAARYADEIDSVEPEGRCHIGGYSAGGVLALALAQELRARGRRVGLLLMFDPDAPGLLAPRRRVRHSTVSFARQFADWLVDDASRTPLSDWFFRLRSKTRRLIAQRHATPAESVDMRDVLGMWRLPAQYECFLRARYEALGKYVATPYDGRTVIIRSRTGRLFEEAAPTRDDDWRRLVTGPLDVHILPGNHDNMLQPPFLAKVVRVVDASLGDADEAGIR